jgi:hypothetical protein
MVSVSRCYQLERSDIGKIITLADYFPYEYECELLDHRKNETKKWAPWHLDKPLQYVS